MEVSPTEELFDSLMLQMVSQCNEDEEENSDDNAETNKEILQCRKKDDTNTAENSELEISAIPPVVSNKETDTVNECVETCVSTNDLKTNGHHDDQIIEETSTTSSSNSSSMVPLQQNVQNANRDFLAKSNPLIFECKGCSSKFNLLRFYYQHMQRKTAEVVYDCIDCDDQMTFPNTCMLKLHMKEHDQKNKEIAPAKLQINMPSIQDFQNKYLLEFGEDAMKKYGISQDDIEDAENTSKPKKCPECAVIVNSLHAHLMEKKNLKSYLSCKDCGFLLPSDCSLRIHRRIHKRSKPYTCPECGFIFITWTGLEKHLFSVCYHFYRSVRSKCLNCGVILPGDTSVLKNHLMTNHNNLIYRCCFCFKFFMQFKDINVHLHEQHGIRHLNDAPSDCLFHKCQLCPGSLIPRRFYLKHIVTHLNDSQCLIYGYKCEYCDFVTLNKSQFTEHLETCEKNGVTKGVKRALDEENKKKSQSNNSSLLESNKMETVKKPLLVPCSSLKDDESSVVKVENKAQCVSCGIQYIRRKKSHIDSSLCCSCEANSVSKCLLCGSMLKKETIIFHFSDYHKIQSNDYSKYMSVKTKPVKNNCNLKSKEKDKVELPKDPLACPSCSFVASTKEDYRGHIGVHRVSGSYQCLECSECFVALSSLEIHLISAHSIKDTNLYITANSITNTDDPIETTKVLKENQCSVCMDEFPDAKTLHMHFRSHGMAFLKQNLTKKTS